MRKRETVRSMTHGQFGDIAATLVGAIPELSFDEATALTGDKGRFVSAIRAVFGRWKNPGVFTITTTGEKASVLIARGEYGCCVSELITDERFPFMTHELTTRTLELVKLGHDASSDKVFKEFKRRRLERPTLEDALQFGIEYPKKERRNPIVFLHPPVKDHFYNALVFALSVDGGLTPEFSDNIWSPACVFAGVRKSA